MAAIEAPAPVVTVGATLALAAREAKPDTGPKAIAEAPLSENPAGRAVKAFADHLSSQETFTNSLGTTNPCVPCSEQMAIVL